MAEVVQSAKEMTQERGYLEGMTEVDKEDLFQLIGMGGLKYYLLKVDPKKRMMFDPAESIELNGNTGPFIQYAHARIKSLLARGGETKTLNAKELATAEKEVIKLLVEYPSIIQEAGRELSPAVICNYIFELVKLYNQFYQNIPILIEKNEELKNMRLVLSKNIAKVIVSSMCLLGVRVPERM